MIGQTISHYRIVEKLGEGGMGVVYKAEDLKLGRLVALKFLSPHLLDSPEHKARFLHEARAAALLDHPNICTVFEIDDVGGQTFLALALLEGQTLKEKIAQRPLPLEEALAIAVQIAQGLQVAHEKGIVHRDIKPANVMITQQGQVKIMDFGLAQLSDRTRLTASGLKLGTPAYMSPEQTEGQPADRRTDIWSLGVVLYEMLSGRLPFRGESDAAVAYGIVHTEPEPVTAMRSGLPIELDPIVAKLLAKDPGQRYQHVDEMVVDLNAVQQERKRSSSQATPGIGRRREAIGRPTDGARPAPSSAAAQRLAWLAAGAGLGLAATFAVVLLREPPREVKPVAFSINTGTQPTQTYAGGSAVSPDGRLIAYVAQNSSGVEALWIRPLDSNVPRQLEGTEGAARPFWSPDGRSLAFFAGEQLKRISVSGGPAISICEAGAGLGGAWSPAGEIVFAPGNRTPLHKVPAAGGQSAAITELDAERSENSHRWPHFLPGGRRFLFTIRASNPENTVLAVGSLDSPEVRRLFRVQSHAQFAPRAGGPGYLLFVNDRALMAQPFDEAALELQGEPVGVAQGLRHNVVSVSADFSISANGEVLAYRRGSGLLQLAWYDRGGRRLEPVGRAGDQIQPRISPDGTAVALSMPDPFAGNRDVWVMNLKTGVPQRLTSNPGNDWQPAWSPDGSRIVFASDRNGGKLGLYQSPASGGGPDEELFADGDQPSHWSPDGRFVLFHRFRGRDANNLWLLPMRPRAEPIPFLLTDLAECDAHFSPDGRWVSYSSNESGRYEVYVRPAPDIVSGAKAAQDGARQISTAGGGGSRWRGDGRELYYLAPDHSLMAVELTPGDRLEASIPKALFTTCDPVFWAEYYKSTYDVAADGQRFLFNCPADDATSLDIVVHWTQRLENPAR